MGDWQSDYLQDLTSTRFAPESLDRLYTIQYEDHHPPLYYLLASPVFTLGNGSLIALRLFSVLLGSITVCLTYAIGKQALPGQPQVALGAMALVAFLPQHLAMMSAVNNDALAEALVACGLLWMIRYLKGNGVPIWQFGVIAGLAILCKITIYFLLLLFPLAICARMDQARKTDLGIGGAYGSLSYLVALVIGGGWWLRNTSAYGFPDFLGLAAHDAVVADQARTRDYVDQQGWINYARQLMTVSFKSFWGQFGWMALPLDSVLGGWIYRGFALLTLAGLTGGLLAAREAPAPENGDVIERRHISIIFSAAILIVLAGVFLLQPRILAVAGALSVSSADRDRAMPCGRN